MTMKLFVYGTLAPGEPNEHILAHITGRWTKGVVRGKRFDSGWGAAMGYPGIILDPEGDLVPGMLFSSSELDAHWPAIDDFEGEGYQRVITEVMLENGESVEAYIYELSEAGR